MLSARARLDPAGDALLLASATQDSTALVPTGASHPLFTGELIRLLKEGDAYGPPHLTLARTTDVLHRRLSEVGQRPVIRYEGGAGRLVVTANRAYTVPSAPAEPDTAAPDGVDETCPFLGLSAFTEEDAPLFFGREEVTESLVRAAASALRQRRPLIVAGASGSGKSSLLRAGLLPAIARGRLEITHSATWPRVVVTPGADPMRALTIGLADSIAAGPELLDRVLLGGQPDRLAKLVLVVDQFEELFSQCPAGDDRAAFVAALAGLAERGGALVVVAVRSDLYGACIDYPELQLAAREAFFVGPMTSDQLCTVITRPAEIAGLVVEPQLVEIVLGDLDVYPRSRRAAMLPLLSHALLSTWQQRTGWRLTVANYLATGRVEKSIATTAEAVYASLNPADKRRARSVLLRLVAVGTNIEHTLRTVDRTDLVTDASVEAVLDMLARARLITVDRGSVQITHEALLHHWPRLGDWIETDHAGLLVHQQLCDAAEAWQRAGRHRAYLYSGPRLTAARTWADEHDRWAGLGATERSFLRSGIRQGHLRRAVAGLAVVLMLVASAGYALAERHSALRQRQIATSHRLIAQASALRDSQPRVAMMLGVEALRFNESSEARSSIVTTLSQTRYSGRLLNVSNLAWTPKGRLIAAVDPPEDGAPLTLWDATSLKLSTTERYLHSLPTADETALTALDKIRTTKTKTEGTSAAEAETALAEASAEIARLRGVIADQVIAQHTETKPNLRPA